jgi:hypothetical protein
MPRARTRANWGGAHGKCKVVEDMNAMATTSLIDVCLLGIIAPNIRKLIID